MSNIFEDLEADYRVLTNAEGQHCLWPAIIDIPAGWDAAYGPARRDECLNYVITWWTKPTTATSKNGLSQSVKANQAGGLTGRVA
jgi:MbtH protein